jgi:hypothetical protein
VTAANGALTALTDALMSPLARFPPMAGLLGLSLLTAVGALLVFKWSSNQPALAATKRRIQAAIFEMRLFSDDLWALLAAQRDVLRHTLRYVRLSLVPTAWLILPVLLLMLHMEFYFGYTGLAVGQAALVKVGLESVGDPGRGSVTLEAPDAVRVETPAVVLPSQQEIVWRIRPRAPGSHELRVRAGELVVGKTLLVSDAVARRSPVRPRDGFAQLLHPSEPPLPRESGFTAITVTYPDRTVDLAGWNIEWPYVYLALTFAFAIALRGVLGVTI